MRLNPDTRVTRALSALLDDMIVDTEYFDPTLKHVKVKINKDKLAKARAALSREQKVTGQLDP